MAKASYKQFADMTNIPAKHFRMMADIVCADNAKELVERYADFLHGFDTGVGFVYNADASNWLRKNRKAILDYYDDLTLEAEPENGIRPPLQLVLDTLNKGLRSDDCYKLSEVMRTMTGRYKTNTKDDPDPQGCIAWVVHGVWFETLALALENVAMELDI